MNVAQKGRLHGRDMNVAQKGRLHGRDMNVAPFFQCAGRGGGDGRRVTPRTGSL